MNKPQYFTSFRYFSFSHYHTSSQFSADKTEIMEKLRNIAVQKLKDQGIEIDPEDPEDALHKVKDEMKRILGLDGK